MPRLVPDQQLLQRVGDAYERGRIVDAWRDAVAFAPLDQWGGAAACVLGARIAGQMGAPRLALRLTARAFRTDRRHPDALAQYCYELMGVRGSLAAWQLLRASEQPPAPTSEQEAELLGLEGRLAAEARDFSTAEDLIARADAMDPQRPWLRLQRARLLEMQDRIEEALDMTRAACALHPYGAYRAGVQMSAHLLQQLDRDEEAIELLRDADQQLQTGLISGQLYGVLRENERWAEAGVALERHVALSPMLEPRGRQWIAAERVRVAYHSGHREEASRLAAGIDDDFHPSFATRLDTATACPDRVQLAVTFVRQHFKTCAPATLAALGRFWKLPTEHLALAEALCYDGTPHWQQRRWAEANGWWVRSFRVTWESATALLERGIPFAITTVETTSAHMMAVVGFDRVRDTLLLRDPSQPYVLEVIGRPFLERYRAFGPRGTLFVPQPAQGAIDGIVLDDVELYDSGHRIALALERHDRDTAAAELQALDDREPNHPLTLEAHLDVAVYDQNLAAQMRHLDGLLAHFPGTASRLLHRYGCMRNLSHHERLAFLDTACKDNQDPALLVALGRAYLGDARTHRLAHRYLRRAARKAPGDSSVLSALADLGWERGHLDEATWLYRVASGLEGFREHLYRSWFQMCRQIRRAPSALAHLEDRVRRFGSRSEQPALTLAWACREVSEPERARQVIESALQLRPLDGALKTQAASLVMELGDAEAAERLLKEARGTVHENEWLTAAADVAERKPDAVAALGYARELLARDPLALAAHATVARCLARLEGLAAALAHLDQAATASPHHYGLRRMLAEWSSHEGPERVERVVRDLLALDPSDGWAQRELALALMRMNREDEALNAAREAVRIEPWSTFSFSVLGHACLHARDAEQAQTHFRKAIELSVDNEDAIASLLQLARSDTERRAQLTVIERELVKQVVTGDGLLLYLEHARPVFEPETLLAQVRQAHRERPDLWHAWSALVSQLAHLGRLDEARAIAEQATRRFGHQARPWLDLALVHRWSNQADAEIRACEQAFEIDPSSPATVMAVADALERAGHMDRSLKIYERALQHAPRSAAVNGWYGSLLWRLRNVDAAIDAIERAIRLAPTYDWAWNQLRDWSAQAGQPGREFRLARALTKERPGEAGVWLMLARLLSPDMLDERLAAIGRAITLTPRTTDVWDAKASALADAERFDEATQACADGEAHCGSSTYVLRGRAAWIQARRGNTQDAIRQMREVVSENVSYVWGWQLLAAWLTNAGALDEAVQAWERLQQLRPFEVWISRELGTLRLKQGNTTAAREAFVRALQGDPTDVASAHSLVDIQLEAAEFEEAAVTVALMQAHQPGATTDAVVINLQLAQGKARDASRTLEALCASPDPDAWPIERAATCFQEAEHDQLALDVFRRALETGSCNPEVGAAAIRLMMARKKGVSAMWVFALLTSDDARRRAASVLVQGLCENKSKWLFRWLFWRHRSHLVADDVTWGKTGYALVSFGRPTQAARWLSDWRRRPAVEPWMLFNLVLALRHLGRYEEATATASHVLTTWPHREGATDMHLFLAVEEALAGRASSAEAHMQQATVRSEDVHDQLLAALTRALVEFQQTPPAERRQRFAGIRKSLEPHVADFRLTFALRDLRRTFWRAARLFHKEGAGANALAWSAWHLHWHWVLVLLSVTFAAARIGLAL